MVEATEAKEVNPARMLNINVGVLGHVDSGKTSLCKALSTVASTAGFDKSPQSQQRGITLDLGFSAFTVSVPDWLRDKHPKKLKDIDHIQFTLVDCPGHASLMKTVIGGASIIDLMILVVDCQKLIQTQTAECIVLGEILMDKLVVAFNKIDMYAGDPDKLNQQRKKLEVQLSKTKFA
jgi:selenocysteine-specific elongation factor